jgi:predicted alpha/beta-hydrolase family hydrolase
LPELLTPTVPRLVLQGTRDTFGTADELGVELAAAGGGDQVVVVPLPGADHGFKTPARAEFRPADLRALLVASAMELVTAVTSVRDRE